MTTGFAAAAGFDINPIGDYNYAKVQRLSPTNSVAYQYEIECYVNVKNGGTNNQIVYGSAPYSYVYQGGPSTPNQNLEFCLDLCSKVNDHDGGPTCVYASINGNSCSLWGPAVSSIGLNVVGKLARLIYSGYPLVSA